MKPRRAAIASALLSTLTSAALAQITPGHLVVARAGDGAFGLTNSAAHLFLDEYLATTPAQTAPLQSIAMPITIAGTSMQGFVTQSVDGRFLVIPGYGAPPYSGLVAFTTAVSTPRVIARIALNGTIDASTVLTNTYSGGANLTGDFISAATVDGSAFWTAGNSSASQPGSRGICYTPLGATTSVQLASTPTSARVADIVAGQLCVSTWFSPFVGVDTVGTGTPTTAGQAVALLPGMPGSNASHIPWDFWFADPATLFVSDARTDGAGGIQKWTKTGSAWALQYTLAPAANVGCRSVSGIRDGSGTKLFATTTAVTGNQLVTVLDTGAGSTFTTLATAAANTGFRGVRFVRQPYSVTISGTACPSAAGLPTIGTAGGLPVSGNGAFGLALGNTPPFSLYLTVVSIGALVGPGLPLALVGGPPCALLYPPALDLVLSGITDGSGNGIAALPLGTPDAALWGLDLPAQHLVLDATMYGAYGLPFATTQALQIELGN